MKNLIRGLAAGLALAITAGALAVTGGGYPSQPTFQSVNVGTGNTGATNGQVKGSAIIGTGGACTWANVFTQIASCGSATPGYQLISMGAGTDAKAWDWYADTGGVMHFRIVSALDWISIARSGIASATVTLPSLLLDTAGGNCCSTATSHIEFRGGNQGVIAQVNASAAVDTKSWQNYADAAGTWHHALVNDNGSVSNDWIQVTRSGATSATVNFLNNTSLQRNGVSLGTTYALDFTATAGGSALNTCLRCGGSPTASRTSAGIFVITHNIGTIVVWSCTGRTTAGTPQPLTINMTANGSSSTTFTTVNSAGTLTDPAASSLIDCTGVS
jgi:hypothetical protein